MTATTGVTPETAGRVAELAVPPAAPSVRRDQLRRVVRGLLSTPASILGFLLLTSFLLIALFAPQLAPCPDGPPGRVCHNEGPYRVPDYGAGARPKPPSAEHPFGLTPQQYDIFYGVVWGTRTAFIVGVLIVGLSLLIGITFGAMAGYYGGWLDEILMRVAEIFMAFPFLIAVIALATVLRTRSLEVAGFDLSEGVVPALAALVVFGWMGYARLIRSDVLSVREREYVWASKSLGASDRRIILKHIVPNSIFPVLVLASLDIGTIVITFAALSFLGVGVPPGYADWGQMISGARDYVPRLNEHWYLVVFPGVAIVLFSLAWNLIGDTVRDLLDPRFSRRTG
jgi:peptide/nickel transport system permease protein